MDSHQQGIVRLAWSRQLGLPDLGLDDGGSRVIAIDDSASTLTYLDVCGARALVGPAWAVERADALPDAALATAAALLDVTRDHPGARSAGPVALAYAADIGTSIDLHDPLISHDLGHVLALATLCAPDDVDAADLAGKRNWFTLLADDRPADSAPPIAAAAYGELQGILADIGVLTAPTHRRRGNAQVVARLATNDAIDEGLIPQWRTRVENGTSRRLAARLGYTEQGVWNSVELSS